MSKSPPPALPTIDLDALSTASGGRRAASTSSSSRVADDRILDALRDVTTALKDLGTKQAAATSTSNNDSTMMMMSMLTSLLGNQNSGCGRKR